MSAIEELLEKRIVIGDGAVGTILHQMLPRQAPLDLAAIQYKDELLKIHLGYIDAGANVIQAFTFGTSRPRLLQKNCEDKFEEVNAKAVKIAREARDISGRDVLIAGSIGPYFQPSHDHTEEMCEIFSEQAVILDERGCDLIMLETFPSIDELNCAIEAVSRVSSLPIIAQLTIPDEWSPHPTGTRDYVLKSLLNLPVLMVGLNCGAGPDEYLEILEEWGSIDEYKIAFQPNAGVPVRRDGRYLYPSTTPEYFGYFARKAVKYGIRYIGGCCGTTPDHIRAAAEAVKDIQPIIFVKTIEVKRPEVIKEEYADAKSGFLESLQNNKFTTIVQLDPPKGTRIESILNVAQTISEHPDVCAVDINANPLGRLHFDSLWLAGIIEQQIGIETIPHITPRDSSLMGLESQLLGAWYSGVKNL
ncbi:MAG: homocysteine S-methyltransferase family protein, partial [bacterium]